MADSARAAVEGPSVVLSMVTDSEALRDVALRPDGILAGLGRGAVWAEMSTVSPTVTRMLGERVAEKGAALLDAPVSGSTVTIAQGQLSFIVGGDAAALERIRPYLLAIGPTITHVGALGLAVTMKIAVNLEHRRADAGLQRVRAARREVRDPAREGGRGHPQERHRPRPC